MAKVTELEPQIRRPFTEKKTFYLELLTDSTVGQDSSVGIATDYWAARFSAHVQTGLGAHLDSYTMGTVSLTKVKRPGRGLTHPPHSSAEVKERVKR
jgi:hypothetical protein